MAIQNRDNATPQQRDVLTARISAAVTGTSYAVALIPYACNLQFVGVAALGLSGAPQVEFRVARVVAAGITSIALGVSTLVLQSFGTSGYQGWSGMSALGATNLQLQAGDLVTAFTSVADTATNQLVVDLVVQKTSDIVKQFTLDS